MCNQCNELGNCVGTAEGKLVYQLRVDEGMDAVKETIADTSNARPSSEQICSSEHIRSDEGLALETPAIVSYTASITHQHSVDTPLKRVTRWTASACVMSEIPFKIFSGRACPLQTPKTLRPIQVRFHQTPH